MPGAVVVGVDTDRSRSRSTAFRHEDQAPGRRYSDRPRAGRRRTRRSPSGEVMSCRRIARESGLACHQVRPACWWTPDRRRRNRRGSPAVRTPTRTCSDFCAGAPEEACRQQDRGPHRQRFIGLLPYPVPQRGLGDPRGSGRPARPLIVPPPAGSGRCWRQEIGIERNAVPGASVARPSIRKPRLSHSSKRSPPRSQMKSAARQKKPATGSRCSWFPRFVRDVRAGRCPGADAGGAVAPSGPVVVRRVMRRLPIRRRRPHDAVGAGLSERSSRIGRRDL